MAKKVKSVCCSADVLHLVREVKEGTVFLCENCHQVCQTKIVEEP
jgi:hypothetical protein